MSLTLKNSIRFIGAGRLDFTLYQDNNIAYLSANLIPQILSPIRRVLQPLGLTGVSRDLTGRIIISFKNIPGIRSITVAQNDVEYPVEVLSSINSDISIALPVEINAGVADLKVTTDTEDYQAKIVTTDDCDIIVGESDESCVNDSSDVNSCFSCCTDKWNDCNSNCDPNDYDCLQSCYNTVGICQDKCRHACY